MREHRRAPSASEAIEAINLDPAFRDRARKAEGSRREMERWLSAQEQPIVDDLARVGVAVRSVWELVALGDVYDSALPVILDHLESGGYPDVIMIALARAMAVKASRPFRGRLRQLFETSRDEHFRDGLAVALAVVSQRADFDDLAELFTNDAYGPSRIFFTDAIAALGGADGRSLLESARDDSVLGYEVRKTLGRADPR